MSMWAVWQIEHTNGLSCTFVLDVYNLKKSLTPSNLFCFSSKPSAVGRSIGTEGGGVAWEGPSIKTGTPQLYLVSK